MLLKYESKMIKDPSCQADEKRVKKGKRNSVQADNQEETRKEPTITKYIKQQQQQIKPKKKEGKNFYSPPKQVHKSNQNPQYLPLCLANFLFACTHQNLASEITPIPISIDAATMIPKTMNFLGVPGGSSFFAWRFRGIRPTLIEKRPMMICIVYRG